MASPALRLASNPVAAGTGLRVVVLDDGASGLRGSVVANDPDDDGRLRPAEPHGPRHLDALVVDGPGGSVDVAAAVAEASEAGAPVVVHLPGGDAVAGAPDAARIVRVGVGSEDGPWPRPVVDTSRVNPSGFRRDHWPRVAVPTLDGPHWRAGLEAIADRLGTGAVSVVGAGDPDLPAGLHRARPDDDGPQALLDALRPFAAVADHPALHTDAAAHAAWLARLCAAGIVPLTLEVPEAVTAALAPRLAALLDEVTAAGVQDQERRERWSVLLRRAAHLGHGADAAWRAIAGAVGIPLAPPPTVSVVLATNRPDHLPHALDAYAGFTYERRELVACLHGDAFPDDAEETVAARVDTPVTVLRCPADRTLGEAMTVASMAASGDLVTKHDDDDFYDADHLDDLVEALRYSDALLVGKGSEFVYLAEIDTTVRRFPRGAETDNRNLAGGTLMIGREDLRRLGWWRRAVKHIDQLLIDDVLAAGATIHRTHGHGFILHRHGHGHTWASSVDYFLQQAVSQWPGVAMEAAGFAPRLTRADA